MDKKQADYLRELTKTNTPLFPFDSITSKIWFLMRSIDVVSRHPEEFPEITERLKLNSVPIGSFLTFYVVQEIQDFYRQAHLLFGDKVSMPETAAIVREIRGEIVAHIKTETSSQIAEKCIALEQKYGFGRIYADWEKFKEELFERIKSKELILPKA